MLIVRSLLFWHQYACANTVKMPSPHKNATTDALISSANALPPTACHCRQEQAEQRKQRQRHCPPPPNFALCQPRRESCKASTAADANDPTLMSIPLLHHHQYPANANKRRPSNASKASAAAPIPTLPCTRQQQRQHARDVHCSHGSGSNVGMGGGECNGKGRGGGNTGSRRGGQWAGRAMLCSIFFFSPIIFLTITATATEGQDDGAAAVPPLPLLVVSPLPPSLLPLPLPPLRPSLSPLPSPQPPSSPPQSSPLPSSLLSQSLLMSLLLP
jgi:hypothetical protein